MSFIERTFGVYPWDVADGEPRELIQRVCELGANGLSILFSCHSLRAASRIVLRPYRAFSASPFPLLLISCLRLGSSMRALHMSSCRSTVRALSGRDFNRGRWVHRTDTNRV